MPRSGASSSTGPPPGSAGPATTTAAGHGRPATAPGEAATPGIGEPAQPTGQDEGGPGDQPVKAKVRLATSRGPKADNVGTSGSARTVGTALLLAVAVLALRLRRPLLAWNPACTSVARGGEGRRESQPASDAHHAEGGDEGE